MSFIHFHHAHYLFLVYGRHFLNHVVIFLSFLAHPLAERPRQPPSSPNGSAGSVYQSFEHRKELGKNGVITVNRKFLKMQKSKQFCSTHKRLDSLMAMTKTQLLISVKSKTTQQTIGE